MARLQNKISILIGIVAISACIVMSCAPFISRAAFDLERVNPEEIKVKIDNNFAKLKTFYGRARVTLEMSNFAYSGFSDVVMHLPDSILVKIKAVFGLEMGSFFSDSKLFKAYIPSEKKVYSGDIHAMELTPLFQINIEFEDLISTFTGIMRLPATPIEILGIEDDYLKLGADSVTGKYIFWIDSKYTMITKAEIVDLEEQVIYRFNFSRFQKIKNIVLPKMITVEQPQSKERVTLYYISELVNIDSSKLNLRLKVPDEVEEIIL